MERATLRLRALSGHPLADQRVRGVVISSAHALAEREGVCLLDLRATDDSLEGVLEGDRIAAIGFAAELRRVTNAWYEGKYGAGPLWGEGEEG